MNGRHKFGYILSTGTVLSDRAIQQLIKASTDKTIIDPNRETRHGIDEIIYMYLEDLTGSDKIKIRFAQIQGCPIRGPECARLRFSFWPYF